MYIPESCLSISFSIESINKKIMHKLIGNFDDQKLSLEIFLDLNHEVSKKLYDKVKAYIENNMFLSFRRQAAKLKRVVISSVGDHLSREDEQDITKADIFIDVEILDEISKPSYDNLMTLPHWPVVISLVKGSKILEQITIEINKTDDMILNRQHKNNVTK